MRENGDKALQKRIRAGEVNRQDVTRRLAELAFGRANDCVRLVLEERPDLNGLDLSLLSEVKRNEKGTVEIRLVDRLRALEQLALVAREEKTELEAFLQAMQGEA
ncbi:MAG: terminase small subunit [Faecousia sp.]